MSKKILTIFMIIALCSLSFAATVSDNDGSAFITKAEFDSLKNDFQSQIDAYNTNIDNKIDAAIASYLAGIKVEVSTVLENKYEQISPTWTRNKRFNKSKLGTKFTEYISFTEVDRGGAGSTLQFGIYLFEGTGKSWYRVEDITKNESEQEYLYRISKKRISTFDDEWSLQDLIKADYSITVVGGAAGGRGGSINANNTLGFPSETLFTKGENEYFSTWYDGLPIEVWEVDDSTKTKVTQNGYIGGSTGNGEALAISAVASDIIEPDEELFYLAGGSMTNDVMYCLNTAEVSKLGDSFETAKSVHGATRQWRINDEGTSAMEAISWRGSEYDSYRDYTPAISAEVYRHKIEEIDSTSILNETITQNVKQRTYYYNGCPLFTATANGKIQFKIKFHNTLAGRTKWALKDGAFTNAANPGNASGIEDCSEKTFLANDDETITVKFKVKKGTTYWIKADPEAGYTAIEFDGDIVQTEES